MGTSAPPFGEDEWARVVDAPSMRSLLKLRSDETFNRRVRRASLLGPIEFSAGDDGHRNEIGRLRYWRLEDAVINMCIEESRRAGIRDVTISTEIARLAADVDPIGAFNSVLAVWRPLRRRPTADRRTPDDYPQAALIVDARLVAAYSLASEPVLPGFSHFEIGLAPDFTGSFGLWRRQAVDASEERNLSAIKRDPHLLRPNYEEWRHTSEHRPDRRTP